MTPGARSARPGVAVSGRLPWCRSSRRCRGESLTRNSLSGESKSLCRWPIARTARPPSGYGTSPTSRCRLIVRLEDWDRAPDGSNRWFPYGTHRGAGSCAAGADDLPAITSARARRRAGDSGGAGQREGARRRVLGRRGGGNGSTRGADGAAHCVRRAHGGEDLRAVGGGGRGGGDPDRPGGRRLNRESSSQ